MVGAGKNVCLCRVGIGRSALVLGNPYVGVICMLRRGAHSYAGADAKAG